MLFISSNEPHPLNVIYIIKWATSSGCTKCHLYHQMGHIFWRCTKCHLYHQMGHIFWRCTKCHLYHQMGYIFWAALNVIYIIKWATSSGCTKCHLYHQMGHIFWRCTKCHIFIYISSNGPHLLALH